MCCLKGRNCLITGASRGLGAGIARSFWDAGGNLLLVARNKGSLEELAKAMPARSGQKVDVLSADLSDPAAPELIVAKARELFGSLDVLVNNAATQGPIGPVWENDWDQWQAALQVNLLAPIALCRMVVPWMAEQRSGKIVNISGGGATSSRPNFSAYAVSKTAIVRFTEILAEEVSNLGIHVNCIAPGAMPTNMLDAIVESGVSRAGQKEYEAALWVINNGSAAMGKAVKLSLFLASKASDGITGKLISAVWDPWEKLPKHLEALRTSDIYTLRRIVPKDRGLDWDDR